MATEKLFEAALGIDEPWYAREARFDVAAHSLTIAMDFRAGSRFAHPETPGLQPMHDTVPKRYRHRNFFRHECFLEVRVPRVCLPDGRVLMIELPWAGKLSGFTLVFEALVLTLCQQMTFAAVAQLVGESWHRVASIARRYVDLAMEQADFPEVSALMVDETSRARGHDYVTLAADAERRAVIFVTEGRGADPIARLAEDLKVHGGDPAAIATVSIDMSPTYIKGVSAHLPTARITFDKFHVIAHASQAIDDTRRFEQISEPSLKGLRWTLLKDYAALKRDQQLDLDALMQLPANRTARAWMY